MIPSPVNCVAPFCYSSHASHLQKVQRALMRNKLSTDFQTSLSQNKCLSSLYFSMNSVLHIHRTQADNSRCSEKKGKQESLVTHSEPGKVTLLLTGCAAHLLDLPCPASPLWGKQPSLMPTHLGAHNLIEANQCSQGH